MSSLKSADDATFQAEVLDSDVLVLVDFWAPWCGPCVRQTPVLEKFATAREDVKIVKVNVDDSPAVASKYGIRSIPTLAVFKSGKALISAMGLQSEGDLGKLVDEAKKKSAAA